MNLCSKKEQTKNCASEKIQKCDEKKKLLPRKKIRIWHSEKKMKSPQEKRKVFSFLFWKKWICTIHFENCTKKEEILLRKFPKKITLMKKMNYSTSQKPMFLFSIFCFTIEKRKRQQINHLQLRWRAKSEKLKCCFSVLLIFLFFCFLFVVNKHILYLWFIHLVLHYRICHCFDQVSLQLAATAKSSTKRSLKMILRGVAVVLTFLLPKRCLTGSQKWLLKQGLANE